MRISKISMFVALAGLSVSMMTASVSAQSLGGLLGVGGDGGGLVNVDLGDTKISVLPDAGSVVNSLGLGGAGAGVSSSSGGSVAGVSLGSGSQDSHTIADLGSGKASLSLGRSSSSGNGGNGAGVNPTSSNGGNGSTGNNGSAGNTGNNGSSGANASNGRNGVRVASTGGSDRESSSAISRLDQLNQLIRGTNLRKAANLRCAANIEVVRLNRWLPRGERSELPSVISRNAVKIGSMQNAFASDPNLDCILRAARLNPNRLIAVDQRGDTLWLLIL